jgi:predicted PurR-regulated permease PerM
LKTKYYFRKLKKDDHAVLGFFFAFILAATMLVFLFACAIPFLIGFTTDLYSASDSIIEDAKNNIEDISNTTIRDRIQDNLQKMQDATEENINYLSFFYQYGWIFVIIVVVFTIFMLARQVVETKSGLGVV